MARKRHSKEPVEQALPVAEQTFDDADDTLSDAVAEFAEDVGAGEDVGADFGGSEDEGAGEDATEETFSEAIGEDALDEFDEGDIDLKVVDEVLSHKDQNARALAIRRAIEERLEARRLSRDLDYLDLDPDD